MVKHRKILLLALIFGVAAALLVNTYIEKKSSEVLTGQITVKAVVAKELIPGKTVITPEMLEIKDIPREMVLEGALQETQDAVGAISRSEIVPGEQVLKNKLVGDKSPVEGLALMIPKGYRAVSLAVNDVSGVAGLLKPGDRVDVLSTLDMVTKDPAGQVINTTITNLVQQNLEVLAVGQKLSASTETEEKKEVAEQQTVTLAVYLNQAQALVQASEKGSVRLLLRSPVDKGTAPLKAYDIRQFLSR